MKLNTVEKFGIFFAIIALIGYVGGCATQIPYFFGLGLYGNIGQVCLIIYLGKKE